VRSINREYLPAVDHLRFGAAALVVLYHTVHNMSAHLAPTSGGSADWIYSNNPLVTFVVEGNTGVALFMVLSGFILTTGSLGRDLDYRSFVRNRLLRVGPLYLVVLMLALVVAGQHFTLWGALQTTLGFGRFSGGFVYGGFAVVLWAVGVELQFYLIFPFFLRLLNERGPRPLVMFVLTMAVLRIVAAMSAQPGLDYDHLTYYSLVGRIDQFLLGMLAAYFFPHVRRHLGRIWVVAIAMVTTVGTLFVYNKLHGHAEPHLWRAVWVDIEGLVWGFTLVSYVATARFGRGRMSRALAWGGERSYGLYLLHVPLLYVVMFRGWVLDVPGGWFFDTAVTGLLVVLPLAVAISALSFAAVEQPFLSLRRRYVTVAPAATLTPTAAKRTHHRAGVPSPRADLPNHPSHRTTSKDDTVRFPPTKEPVGA
jgi:peptidoglycan/LPS O-acetylase OafA/YrhL